MTQVPSRLVPGFWRDGAPARSYGALTTDGSYLRSYGKVIGLTVDRKKILGEFTSRGKFYSITTSRHVGSARGQADSVVSPEEFQRLLDKEV